jgi:hypothetical protein
MNPPVTVLPKLKNLFDFLYLDYKDLAQQHNVPVKRLKYYLVNNIKNSETQHAAEFAIHEAIEPEGVCYE